MSTSSSSKLKPTWKKGWKHPHEAFQTDSRELVSGPGLKFHSFSSVTLGDAASKDTYIAETGLEETTTKQTWGTVSSSPIYRSRRGSISGFTTLLSGEVQAWRLHSLPTSEALKDASVDDDSKFDTVYKERAKLLEKQWVNSKGSPQTANSVLSDIGKVGFDASANTFVFGDVTHAAGISGVAIAGLTMPEKRALYHPSIQTAKNLSGDPTKEPRPESTFHSEPAALTLHNYHRVTRVEDDSGLIGAFASFPNQVCKQCGETFHAFGGSGSYISGEPGRPFGGQKVGEGTFSGPGATVFRATPASELLAPGNTTNQPQVKSIFKYHHVNRPKPSLAPTSISTSTSTSSSTSTSTSTSTSVSSSMLISPPTSTSTSAPMLISSSSSSSIKKRKTPDSSRPSPPTITKKQTT
jgi:hypothetical protein